MKPGNKQYMKAIISHIKNLDWVLFGSAILLTLIGLFSLYSFSIGRGNFSDFHKQLVFFGIGCMIMILFSFLDWRLLKNDSYIILFLYILGTIALAGLFLFAPQIKGTKGWYRIGGISIDPIEYMKLIMIILMAKYFSMRHIEVYRMRHIFISGIYFAIPIFLIFLQPNLGSALVLGVLWIVTLLVSGIKIRHFLGIIVIAVLIFSLGWTFMLHDYQKNRILSFIEPQLDPLGIGWSQMQAKIAIGNGGVWGQGIGKGTQTQYLFLSEPHTDFIFAAIGEEFGLLGVLGLFGLFLILIWKILRIGMVAQSNFPRLFAIGFATVLIFQFFVNVGMNLGVFPIIGLSLPFVSYGGSSLILSFVGLGILQSIKTH